MKDKLLMLSIKLRTLLDDERGQDLVEYGLVMALVAFAAVAAMKTLASDVSTLFSNIASAVSSNSTVA